MKFSTLNLIDDHRPEDDGARTVEQQKRLAQVCKHSWAGFLAYSVEIVGETPHYYRVKALQPFTLPSRRHLAVGDVALVPKTAVRIADIRPEHE